MYAITFDLDMEMLKSSYHNNNYQNAYGDIRKILCDVFGFSWQQGSVYFGDSQTDAVKCVMVVQELAMRLPWFSVSIRDIRMLRIEENNDLMPAINLVGNARAANILNDVQTLPIKNKLKNR